MANEKHAARNHRLNLTVAIPGAAEGIKHAEETTQTTHAQSKQLRLRSEPNIKQTAQEKQIDNLVSYQLSKEGVERTIAYRQFCQWGLHADC